MDDTFGAKVVAKHGANVDVNRDAKKGINNDATLGAYDQSKNGIDMV